MTLADAATGAIPVPTWVASAILVVVLGQLVAMIVWGIHADRRLAVFEHRVSTVTQLLERHSVDVIRRDLDVVTSNVVALAAELQRDGTEHRAAHRRNHDRIDEMRRDLLAAVGGKHA